MNTVRYCICTKYKVYVHAMQQGDTYLLHVCHAMFNAHAYTGYLLQCTKQLRSSTSQDTGSHSNYNCECTAKVQEDTVAAVK